MSLVLSQRRPLSTNEAAQYCADHLVWMVEPKFLWSSFNLCLLGFLCFSVRTGMVLLSLTHDTGGTQANFLAFPTLLMAVDWARLQKPLCPLIWVCYWFVFPFLHPLFSPPTPLLKTYSIFSRDLCLWKLPVLSSLDPESPLEHSQWIMHGVIWYLLLASHNYPTWFPVPLGP